MYKIKNNGFSLIELIVVTTIIAIISASGSIYFYSFLNNKELKDKLYVISRDINELDLQVRSYAISDYELNIKTSNSLGYYYYTNYFDNTYYQTLSTIDFSSGTGSVRTNDILLGNPMELKLYTNSKLVDKVVINSVNTYTGTFNNYSSNKISSTFSGFTLNDIYINYFGDENLVKNEDNNLKLTSINTKEDKTTGTSITNLVIKNTGKGKEIYGDGTKYNEVYLFFTKQALEDKIKIFTK